MKESFSYTKIFEDIPHFITSKNPRPFNLPANFVVLPLDYDPETKALIKPKVGMILTAKRVKSVITQVLSTFEETHHKRRKLYFIAKTEPLKEKIQSLEGRAQKEISSYEVDEEKSIELAAFYLTESVLLNKPVENIIKEKCKVYAEQGNLDNKDSPFSLANILRAGKLLKISFPLEEVLGYYETGELKKCEKLEKEIIQKTNEGIRQYLIEELNERRGRLLNLTSLLNDLTYYKQFL